jgi:polysaccharide biosynthesis transport protein
MSSPLEEGRQELGATNVPARVRRPLPEVYPQGSAPSGRVFEAGGLPLGKYLRVLRERWVLVATVFLVVTAGVSVGTLLKEPTYRATGTIEIRKQAAEVVPMDALFQFERISDQYLQTEYGTLRSRALLQRMFEDPKLASRLLQETGRSSASSAELSVMPKRLAERAQKRVIVDPVAGSRIVRVSFESPDPRLSADIVNRLIEHYIAMRRESAAAALVKLDEQADSVRSDLLESEHELQRFIRENDLGSVVIAGSDGEIVPQERLRILQQELTQAETDGYRAAALSTAAAAQPTVAAESDLLRTLRVRIAELEGEYARLRPTFTDSFPRMRQLRSELAQLDSLVAAEQRRVGVAMATQHQTALRRRELLQAAVAQQQQVMEALSIKVAEYQRRQRDAEALTQLYAALQQKRKEAALSAALATMDVAVLDAAVPPGSPVRPLPKRDIPLGAMTGLLLGIGLAFLRQYTDTTLKTPQEAGELVRAPLLAMIPAVPIHRQQPGNPSRHGERGSSSWHRIDGGGTQDLQLAEAFRGLRTSVLYDAGGSVPRTLLVTSSVPGEGKTTVSANLAISMAMLDKRVLLVDADMRRPSLHRLFGVSRKPGLAEELSGACPWEYAICHGVSPGVDLLPAGDETGNPSDYLSGEAFGRWLTQVSVQYDFVILDAPALFINVPDARIISHAVDGVLLVVRSGSTAREVVERLVAQTPNLAGVVLNQLDLKALPGYYSEYGEQAQRARTTNGAGRPQVHGSTGGNRIPAPRPAVPAGANTGGDE